MNPIYNGLRNPYYSSNNDKTTNPGLFPAISSHFSSESSEQKAATNFCYNKAQLCDKASIKSLSKQNMECNDNFSLYSIRKNQKKKPRNIMLNSFYNNSPCYTNFFGDE